MTAIKLVPSYNIGVVCPYCSSRRTKLTSMGLYGCYPRYHCHKCNKNYNIQTEKEGSRWAYVMYEED